MSEFSTIIINHISSVNKLMQHAQKEKNTAYNLYQIKARNMFFYIQAISRFLSKITDEKKIKKVLKKTKKIEDLLGKIDYYDSFYVDGKTKNAPQVILDFFYHKTDEFCTELNNYLINKNWIGKEIRQIEKLSTAFKSVNLPNKKNIKNTDELLVDLIISYYKSQIDKIKAEILKPFKELELHVHEMRRELRWLSIFPQALPGFFTLLQNNNAVGKQIISEREKKSPFNQFTINKKITKTVNFDKNSFYTLSWMIAELGEIKDEGLQLWAYKEACEFQNIILEKDTTDAIKNCEIKIIEKANKLRKVFIENKCLENLMVV